METEAAKQLWTAAHNKKPQQIYNGKTEKKNKPKQQEKE